MFKYIGCLIVLLIIFFCYCHIDSLKKINNTLNILQVSDPDPELSYELFKNHQPIVFQRELFFWKEFNKLLDKSLSEIKEIISTNNIINYTEIIKINLEPYNLPLSYDWSIDIRNIILNDKNGIFFIQQKNYLQCFGCVTGEFRIIITPPDQISKLEPLVNQVSSTDATSLLEKEPIELNFIEIIIRKGNLIYIPWNWLYFIYKPNHIPETVIIDCLNNSIISII
jgi:hypothetical protein